MTSRTLQKTSKLKMSRYGLLKGHILRITAHRHLIFFWQSQKGLFLLIKTYFMTKRVQKLERKIIKNMPENLYFPFTQKQLFSYQISICVQSKKTVVFKSTVQKPPCSAFHEALSSRFLSQCIRQRALPYIRSRRCHSAKL